MKPLNLFREHHFMLFEDMKYQILIKMFKTINQTQIQSVNVFLPYLSNTPAFYFLDSCQFSAGQSSFGKDISENTAVGTTVLELQVYPRDKFSLEPHDGSPLDVTYFKYEEIGKKDIIVKVAKSLEDIVDQVSFKWIHSFSLSQIVGMMSWTLIFS